MKSASAETLEPISPNLGNMILPQATSLTHQHILAVINTKLATMAADRRSITICDIGCGNGSFLSYIATCLPQIWPDLEFTFHGVDVSDSGVQAEGFFASTVATLAAAHSGVNWANRLHLISSRDPWPFESGSVDIITSNQVLEHVFGHDHFMQESYRVLSTGGVGIHLFPLKHVLWEDHVKLPLAHKIGQHDLIAKYFKATTRIGLGVYKDHRDRYGHTLDYFAEEHADFMKFMTNYKSAAQIIDYCKQSGLRATFAHTSEYYVALVRKKLRKAPRYTYRDRGLIASFLSYFVCRYLSSVTLIAEKKQIYAR